VNELVEIGVTGTRNGMSRNQRVVANRLLDQIQPDWLHHGDCVGVDSELHDLAIARGIKIKIHPPDNPSHQAGRVGDVTAAPQPYTTRNRDIVNQSALLLAFPEGMERTRSGTWSTIRYARKQGKSVTVVTPDGRITNT
jgi:hypothetical protein